uniref:Uncharacterized protein n=1 Tax=Cyanoderma ruficeps TaxID=181631 RepID=A0A8C3RAX9_9PASS
MPGAVEFRKRPSVPVRGCFVDWQLGCRSHTFSQGKSLRRTGTLSLENWDLCSHHLLLVAFISLSSLCTDRGWTCCPKGWRRFQRSCYFLSLDMMNWAESQQNCTGMGSQGFDVTSGRERK